MSIEFKIRGVQYTVKEPTIKDYYNLQNELVSEGLAAKMNIVSHLSGCSLDDLKLIDRHQFTALWDHVATSYFDISETSAYHQSFLFNSKQYGFLDMANVTLGEFADMDVIKADPQSQKKLHLMMAILYRPAIQITEKWMEVSVYNSDEANKRAEEFLDLPLKYVYGALAFFLQVSKYLYENIVDSLTKNEELTQAQKQLLETASHLILELLETGITSSSIAQMKTSPKLKKLSELVLLESSTSLRTKQINEKKKSSLASRWSLKIKDKLTWR